MYGMRVHEAAIDAGVRVTGVTVHFVDEEYDRGPIIAQYPVPVMPNDTAATLADRVLDREHALYPPVLEAVALGHVTLGTDGRVAGLDSLTSLVLPWTMSTSGERRQPTTSNR